MYRLIVAAKIRGIFTRLNAGDSEAMRAWWGRVFQLLPGIRFEPRDVLVAGWPWSTRVTTDLVVHVTLPDGTRYENVINQFVELRWGRVTEIRTLEDMQRLAGALELLAASGYSEAAATPITDGSVADARPRQRETT